jgi:hypothetical protein
MKPSEKRLYKKIIDKLSRGPAPLSTNKGRIDRSTCKGANSKDRRHSGRVTFFSDDDDYPTQLEFWDEWNYYKDGQRDKSNIIKNIYPTMYWHDEEFWDKRDEIEKIKKRERIRKVRKRR